MKYQIEDIKEGVEFIIDDDHIFDELIEFYLPFRLSELSSLDPSKPGNYNSSLIEAFFRDGKSPEIEDWADTVVNDYNCDHAIRFYVALAAYADKNKVDRVLALDIIYCLIGLTNHQGFDDTYSQFEMSHLTIAKRTVTDWGNHEVAKFLVERVLINDNPCPSLTNLELDIRPYYFGVLSDLFGSDLYFDAAKTFLELEMIESDESGYFEVDNVEDISDLVDVVQLSLEHLDNDKWAREIYKKTLDYYGIADRESECISEIAYSIAVDLKDKKWAEEVYKEILTYAHENTTPEGLREIEKSMDEALGGGR